jgi:hypothetical protein
MSLVIAMNSYAAPKQIEQTSMMADWVSHHRGIKEEKERKKKLLEVTLLVTDADYSIPFLYLIQQLLYLFLPFFSSFFY